MAAGTPEMMRGTVADRPWGITLASLGLGAHTGQLALHSEDNKLYRIVFANGVVVGASSPLASDSVARIALTSHLVTSSQVPDLVRRLAAPGAEDEIKVVADAARLSMEQATRLRRRVLAQRAARTFSIDRGMFVVEDRITIPVTLDSELDIRAVIYSGIRGNLSAQRLVDDLRQFGSRFVLVAGAVDSLPRFGFTKDEEPIIEALRSGTCLSELERTNRELDPRNIQAVLYALAACGLVQRSDSDPIPAYVAKAPEPVVSRTPTQREPTVSRTPTLREPTVSPIPVTFHEPTVSRAPTQREPTISRTSTPRAPTISRAPTGPRQPTVSYTPRIDPLAPAPSRTSTDAFEAQPTTMRADPKTLAREAFKRGEAALRVDQPAQAVIELRTACELDPYDIDYLATLGWAQFCAAADKRVVVKQTRRVLAKAIHKSPKPEVARFYLGRVERMLGDDTRALLHFQEVLELNADHAEAASEVRAIESRLARGTRPPRNR